MPITPELLKALDEAGYVVVPKEPTEAMLESGADNYQACDVWYAMLAAALAVEG